MNKCLGMIVFFVSMLVGLGIRLQAEDLVEKSHVEEENWEQIEIEEETSDYEENENFKEPQGYDGNNAPEKNDDELLEDEDEDSE